MTTVGFTPVDVRYALSDEQRSKLRRLAPRETLYFVLMTIVVQTGFRIFTVATGRDAYSSALRILDIVSLVALVAMFGAAIVFARTGPRIVTRGDLRFSAEGFAGTLDGKPIDIPWRNIDSIRASDGILVFTRRAAFAWPPIPTRWIAIPTAALPDPAAFWKQLDDLLVAKRGLVRSSNRRTTIVNTRLTA